MKRILDPDGVKPQIFFTALLAIIILFIHIRFYEYGHDDAYIHFRVARNLLETGTPYYNLAEAVKVSTSSGWIILLVPVIWVTRLFQAQSMLPLTVSILNSIFIFLGMLVYTKVLNSLTGNNKPHFLIVAAFQIAYTAFMIPASVGLMETPLAILLAGLGIYLIQSDRREGYIFLGMAAYVRIELAVVILLAGLIVLIQKRNRIIEAILFTTLGLLPFVVFDLYFFRSIVPNSIAAKSIIYSISGIETLSNIVFSSLPTYFLISNNILAFVINLIILTIILYLTSRYGWREWFSNKNPYLLLIVLWSVLVISLYVGANALIFDWYMPLYTIPITVAITATVIAAKPPHSKLANILFFFLFLVCFNFLGRTIIATFNDPSKFSLFESGSRVKVYRKVASILNSEYPQSKLLSSEIGGLGYEFTGEILDAAGLASTTALKYHPLKVPEQRERGNLGAIPPAFVEETLPEIIVSYDTFGMALLSSEISEQYNIVVLPAFLPEDRQYSTTGMVWGNKYLRVYFRKDLPVSDAILEMGID